MMETFAAYVKVRCATKEQAEQVLNERLDHDEDYGFEYTVKWERGHPLTFATRPDETRL